ncbi:hypothetical protein BN14_11950 [Rhizoctonia solani AG-1 IB]|uniref:Uncharacterized protein n=1 Tax=Thanatephorus cucumeris (strain AG1-IB / isolate 7/3/14) TaxID=1108050 RepID=M5CEX3_THACB|nr:hypothetical protein BN14_11950 [Rhizoctonia solani AG-1 IB]
MSRRGNFLAPILAPVPQLQGPPEPPIDRTRLPPHILPYLKEEEEMAVDHQMTVTQEDIVGTMEKEEDFLQEDMEEDHQMDQEEMAILKMNQQLKLMLLELDLSTQHQYILTPSSNLTLSLNGTVTLRIYLNG